MPGLSDYAENVALDYMFGSGTIATFYLALLTAAPTDAGGGTEVSGGSYARKSVTNNSTNFPAAASGTKNLHVAQTFVTPTGSWGTVTHWGIYDASSGGNLIAWAALTSSQTISSGNTVSFGVDQLQITLD
jgi:hypothetical protein